jgi:hypothetical protein
VAQIASQRLSDAFIALRYLKRSEHLSSREQNFDAYSSASASHPIALIQSGLEFLDSGFAFVTVAQRGNDESLAPLRARQAGTMFHSESGPPID